MIERLRADLSCRANRWSLGVAATAAIVVGVWTFPGSASNRPLEKELDDIQVYSFDTGGHTARVWIWCAAGNGVYMVGDTDQFQVIEGDPECAEGGAFDS